MDDVVNKYDESFYTVISQEGRNSAEAILPIVFEMFKPLRILDVGAGAGSWSKVCSELGSKVTAIDGPYVPKDMREVSPEDYLECDLTKTWPKAVLDAAPFDMSICLEVAEHISHEQSDLFIDQLCKTSKKILFSAAIPYQGGTHHVNENWIAYWDSKFALNNYTRMDLFRSRIWEMPEVSFWYRQNLFLFVHKDEVDSFMNLEIKLPNDIVHPELYLWSVHRNGRPGNYERDRIYRDRIHGEVNTSIENPGYGSEFVEESGIKWIFQKILDKLRN